MQRPKPVKHVCLPGEKPELLFPIEGELDLTTHVDFQVNGRQFGIVMESTRIYLTNRSIRPTSDCLLDLRIYQKEKS
jgi:hypothetical protein